MAEQTPKKEQKGKEMIELKNGITKDEALERIKELTDSIKNEGLRQDIIDFTQLLYEDLEARIPENQAFGFTEDDVKRKFIELALNDLKLSPEQEAQINDAASDNDFILAEQAGIKIPTKEQCSEVLENLLTFATPNWDELELAINETLETKTETECPK